MQNKGFTLMEILAVLLIIAVITTFAVPGIRAVRGEVRHAKAKSAAIKFAEAMRSYYKDTHGCLVEGLSDPSTYAISVPSCQIKAHSRQIERCTSSDSALQLFACDYLSVKDFKGLPYNFVPHGDPFNKNGGNDNHILLTITGTNNAGRHAGQSFIVYRDMSLKDD